MEEISKIILSDLNYLSSYISNASSEKKQLLLEKTKERFIIASDDKPFYDVINVLDDEELKVFLDKDSSELLINNNQLNKIEMIMNLSSNHKNKVLSSNIMIDYIYINYLKLEQSIRNLDSSVSSALADYMIDNNLFICMDRLSSFSDDTALHAIKSNIDDIKNNINKLPKNFINLFGPNTIEYLLNQNEFEKAFLSYDLNNVLNLLVMGIKLPDVLVQNKKFTDKLVNSLDVEVYREILSYLEVSSPNIVSKIEESKRKKSDSDINNLKDDMLPDFNNIYRLIVDNKTFNDNQTERDIDKDILKLLPLKIQQEVLGIVYSTESKYMNEVKEILTKFFKKLSDDEFLGIIIDTNYKCTVRDFMSDFQFITMQNEQLNENNEKRKLIDLSHYDTYLTLINFSLLSTKEKQEFYNSFDKNIDYKNILLEDETKVDSQYYENYKKSA